MPGTISLLPEGYEATGPKLKDIQDKATAAMVRDVAHRFLAPANRTADLGRSRADVRFRRRPLPARPRGADRERQGRGGRRGGIAQGAGRATTVIDGRGKTLLPGLWDSHQHVGGDDWNLLQNVATGMTNYRSPGSRSTRR